MSKVDWSLAPEEATHFLPEQVARGWVPCFYRNVGGTWYARNVHDVDWYVDYDYVDVFEPLLIERPKQPQAWSGPEDALPPVGIKVLMSIGEVTVLAHGVCRGLNVAICQGKNTIHTADKYAFHPLCTPEQLAADKRESAIREFMDIVGVDCRVTASKAVDAGFKREVV